VRGEPDQRAAAGPALLATGPALLAAVVLGGVLALAGCGGAAAPGGPRYELRARQIPGLGTVVTDGQGFTLYMYGPDHRGTPSCTGFCAEQWPPLLLPRGVSRALAGHGVRAAMVGAVRRANGQLQVTYNGWPLYLWIGDRGPGQATGQADDMGLWYVMSVTGAVDKGTPRS
jgi:predicted lipoprotein with Yx(FWY)xxD motif